MPRSSCDVCCNPTELARAIDSYRSSVLITLCDIVAAIEGGGGVTSNVNLTGINGVTPAVGNGATNTGTLRVTISSDSTGQVTLAAGANIIGSLVPNQSVNVAQMNGVTTSMGNGTTDIGTQRVTISSDSTGQVTLATGSVVNIRFNSVTPSVGNGTSDTGTLRVTVASDSTGQIKLAAGAAIIGSLVANQSVNVAQMNGVTTSMGNGTTDTGTQRVTLSSDSTGTMIVTQATAANLNAQVVGNIAHDGVDSGNPVKIGAKAIAFGTNPTAVAAADRTDVYANRAGVPFVLGGHPNIITIELAFTAAQTNVAIVTVSAGTKLVVTRCSVLCANSNTVDVAVRVGFATATTPTTTGVVLTHPGIAPGSGVVEGNGAGILGVGADDEDLRITATVPTTGSGRVIVSYFSIES